MPPLAAPHRSPGFVSPWIAAGIAVALIVGILLNVDQAGSIPGKCPLQTVAKGPCPGCGLTRSVVATLELDFQGAVSFHPVGPVLVAGALLVLAGFALERTLRRPLVRPMLGRRPVRLVLWCIALAWLSWAAARFLTAANP